MVEPLRDVAYFKRVFLEFGAPTWPNGFDIAPEWLRREMEAASELTRVTPAVADWATARRGRAPAKFFARPDALIGVAGGLLLFSLTLYASLVGR